MGQGDNIDIRSYCNLNNIHSYVFSIWLMSSLILNKAFSGLLLNTFFLIESKPVVTTLQNIRDNQKLKVLGNQEQLSYLSSINRLDIDDLLLRMKENKTGLRPENMTQQVINGEAVVLHNSFQRKRFIEVTKSYHDKIFTSEVKYLPNYISFMVNRNKNFTKLIVFL